jgi:hypothetical protein
LVSASAAFAPKNWSRPASWDAVNICKTNLGEGVTCAGLTTTIGRPAPARPAATTASKPPVASIATIFGDLTDEYREFEG